MAQSGPYDLVLLDLGLPEMDGFTVLQEPHKLGVAQTYVIVTLFYWLIVPIFSLIRLQNPLRLHQSGDRSFWIGRKPTGHSLDRAKQQS